MHTEGELGWEIFGLRPRYNDSDCTVRSVQSDMEPDTFPTLNLKKLISQGRAGNIIILHNTLTYMGIVLLHEVLFIGM